MFSAEVGPAETPAAAKVQTVDDFVPDERLDRSFLEDSLPLKTRVPQSAPAVDSDRSDVNQAPHLVSDGAFIWSFLHQLHTR